MAKVAIPKIKFTHEDDERLTTIVERLGTENWDLVSQEMKTKNARQCRERWINYLSPELRNDPWTDEEDKMLDELYQEFGSRWHKIAEFFPTRSGNCIRNRFKLRQRRALRKKSKKDTKIIKNGLKVKKNDNTCKDSNSKIMQFLSTVSQEEIFNLFYSPMDSIDELI
ncbi:Myb-like DNA-binding domain containing protein [Trichomonas vaginalis G3]|uniref:Myb-like DNA-binding domain containing protein n=1 Tax=Trichomonas vaginalis (strain ATCC PRA-98 / G3) TaxID=412133 RepID=A2FKG6_TRIV3|nr:RNA polymerase II transcription regulator recruiting protein [Trichomonas vaginalis G3]EAX94607.1 Myb-like DNA-binding domain containing protein [Trichomonas vaginalis G3]KAI5513453.1 RNA polymerase II transcription regulator recruiting protein [Trichomonas vaginalis G3]|eukprot:XP_001307537.1 Myb-like DNA-binding domain containing protein [Trichomonas vaginalis G3]